ncbi:PH domain-containing protein [Pengzhenrongella phosphoraccumulans]|uniref:PH domain-containing protein n=1 Tax=Pengzhenrongella phosphoraccumulans TaxID=3114394 RepID=UPI003890F61E
MTEPVSSLASDGPASDSPATEVVIPEGLTWRRMHPVTPAVKGWKVLAVLLVIAAQQVGNNVQEAGKLLHGRAWLIGLAIIVGGALIGFGYAAIAWRMTRFAIDDDAVYLHSGVLFRQQRKARLDRLQAVDVVQPVLARILGLAELKLEVAGGAGSGVSLAFLNENDAAVLRTDLLARAAGIRRVEGAVAPPPVPEQHVLEVTPTQLMVGMARSGATIVLVLGVIALTTVVVWSGEFGSIFVMVPASFGFVAFYWGRFTREFNFRAAISHDGIGLHHGLLEARSQTVPPGRVQALRLTQGPFWRGPGWWRVEMNVAGYSGAEAQSTENVLLPVGSRDQALVAVWLVLPDLGVTDPRALLAAGMDGTGEDEGFTTMPRRARWLDPFAWRRTGFVVTDRALLIRSGWLIRRLTLVPHERTQSLSLEQGPIQRKLGVASLVVHSTPGPVSPRVPHLQAAVAGELMTEQAARARTARASAGPELWRRPEGDS